MSVTPTAREPVDALPPPAPPPRRRRSLAGTIAHSSAANIAVPLSAILTGPLLARVLGAEGRGELAAVLSPVLLVALIGTLGMPEAVVYAVARRQAPVRRILRSGLVIGVGSGVISAVALFLLAPVLLRNAPEHVALLRWLCLVVVVVLTMGAVRAVAQGLRRFDVTIWERWLSVLTRVPLLFVLAFAGGLTVASAAWVTNLTAVASMLVLWLALRQPYSAVEDPDGLTRRLLVYGAQSWTGTVASILVLRLDQVLLAPLVGSAELGYYAVAVSLAEVPATLSIAVRDVIFSAAAGDQDPHLVARASRMLLLVTAGSAAAGVLLAPALLPLVFGSEFRPAVEMAQILFLSGVPSATSAVIGAGLLSAGKPGARSVALIAGLVVNVTLLVALVGPLGAIGAAWATVGAYIAISTLVLLRFRATTGIPVGDCVVPTRDDVRDLVAIGRRLARL
jgi:O-antigen/teichoic acid export membrane protein